MRVRIIDGFVKFNPNGCIRTIRVGDLDSEWPVELKLIFLTSEITIPLGHTGRLFCVILAPVCRRMRKIHYKKSIY